MDNSGFLYEKLQFRSIEKVAAQGETCETFIVNIDDKNYFMKRLRAEFVRDTKYRILFEKEYEVGCSLNTVYIPQYVKLNNEDDDVYILMEYILGDNIAELLDSNPRYFCNESNVYKMLFQLLEGLAELHKRDILYLDMNPGNIMLTKYGNNVKIVDLGFCANAAYYQTAGYTVGFAAPEVEEKRENEIDARSDIYSVGLLLYYIKERSGARFSRHLNGFMQRCLSKEKSGRFANCEEAIKALKSMSKWRMFAGAAVVVAVVAAVLFARQPINSTTQNGVDYSVLSHDSLTCTVTGGVGDKNNIYIEPEVVIGDNVYRTVAIKDSAFSNRDILSVYIPEGIEVIGKGAFYCCKVITSINLPSTIKDFTGAFCGMESMHKVKIPVVKEISRQSFVDCALYDLYIPEGVERICLDAFVSNKSLKKVSLPQSLKVLERGVFYNCTTLEELVLPSQVQEVGDYAFFKCDSLRALYCLAPVPPRITGVSERCLTIYVPAEYLDAYKADFNWGVYNICPIPE